ncbi:MAG: gliding motility-associated C-terminal domain-containing protein [Chitinophagales bacterium]|nr:gliding motility-associated C-terminal domain-containing protein [Chitinophagales bacterium]
MLKPLISLLCVLFMQSVLQAQFILNGDAIDLGDGCYQLTEEVNTQAGSVWYETLINLEEDFTIDFTINLGDLDASGADGIAFVLQPVSTGLGSSGGGIGYEGIEPSLDIEFDTWQNFEYDDPSYDHISIMQDGALSHSASTNLEGPEYIIDGDANAEDGLFHAVKVTWIASTQTISVYVDCSFRISYSGDIIEDIFSSDPFVYVGYTAATGGAYNYQTICFDYITAIDALTDTSICAGDSLTLFVPEGYAGYLWTPDYNITSTTENTTIVFPAVTTIYTVALLDACGDAIYDTAVITVNEVPDVDLGEDITACEGETVTIDAGPGLDFNWNTGENSQTIEGDNGGLYWVTVSNGGCTATDTINVTFLSTPNVELGNDTLICNYEEIFFTLYVSSPEADIEWQNGSANSSFVVNAPGIYYVTAANGICTASDTIHVTLKNCTCVLHVPNVFSPNADGINDNFTQVACDVFDFYDMRIYNRWGEFVFQTNNATEGWDGKFLDKECELGSYVYVINYTITGGEPDIKKGSVILIR